MPSEDDARRIAELEAEVSRLRKQLVVRDERDKLRADLEFIRGQVGACAASLRSAMIQREKDKRRIAELEEALEPLCIEIDLQLDYRELIPVYVRAGDARKARAALGQPKEKEGYNNDMP